MMEKNLKEEQSEYPIFRYENSIKEAEINEPVHNWYAVAVGRNANSTGIYGSWAVAQIEVNRVSGACFQRFNTYKEAKNFLYQYKCQKEQHANDEIVKSDD
jgi:viroplasmin and RNaseH domain-containing protein